MKSLWGLSHVPFSSSYHFYKLKNSWKASFNILFSSPANLLVFSTEQPQEQLLGLDNVLTTNHLASLVITTHTKWGLSNTQQVCSHYHLRFSSKERACACILMHPFLHTVCTLFATLCIYYIPELPETCTSLYPFSPLFAHQLKVSSNECWGSWSYTSGSKEGLLANNYHKMKYTCTHPLLPHPVVELRLCCLSPGGQGDQMDQSAPVAGEREEGDVLAQSGFIEKFRLGWERRALYRFMDCHTPKAAHGTLLFHQNFVVSQRLACGASWGP